ncbi:MAG: hypothetical protein ACRDIB_20170 [Ardenticatenaceae bacterium]
MNEQVVEVLKGYARANEFIELERQERLARMTPEEARTIGDDLVESWERVASNKHGLERLDSWRIETKVAVRQAFRQLAEARGWI